MGVRGFMRGWSAGGGELSGRERIRRVRVNDGDITRGRAVAGRALESTWTCLGRFGSEREPELAVSCSNTDSADQPPDGNFS
ncbi:hypothetical protein PT2222_20066 [Paraburkholderia tropica]